MASENFTLKILTPAGILLEEVAATVTVPAYNGQIGLLPMHVRYTGCLGTGVLEVHSPAGQSPRKVAVAGGFCTFADETLTVLADWAVLPEDVNRNSYAAERDSLSAVVKDASTWESSWAAARDKLARIEAIDAALGGH